MHKLPVTKTANRTTNQAKGGVLLSFSRNKSTLLYSSNNSSSLVLQSQILCCLCRTSICTSRRDTTRNNHCPFASFIPSTSTRWFTNNKVSIDIVILLLCYLGVSWTCMVAPAFARGLNTRSTNTLQVHEIWSPLVRRMYVCRLDPTYIRNNHYCYFNYGASS